MFGGFFLIIIAKAWNITDEIKDQLSDISPSDHFVPRVNSDVINCVHTQKGEHNATHDSSSNGTLSFVSHLATIS